MSADTTMVIAGLAVQAVLTCSCAMAAILMLGRAQRAERALDELRRSLTR